MHLNGTKRVSVESWDTDPLSVAGEIKVLEPEIDVLWIVTSVILRKQCGVEWPGTRFTKADFANAPASTNCQRRHRNIVAALVMGSHLTI